jgi:hypothetical protein
MNKELLSERIRLFAEKAENSPEMFKTEFSERAELVKEYQTWTADRLRSMNEDDLYSYIAPLWAMLMWGNKHHVVNKAIANNGMDVLRENLADLVWGVDPIAERWDRFRNNVKNIGPAMMSEILCKTHPDQYALWNRRAYIGLDYLGVKDLPRHSYQITGAAYERICELCRELSLELKASSYGDSTLLAVDYFIWEELQVVDNLNSVTDGGNGAATVLDESTDKTITAGSTKFVHNDTRDMLRDIGDWLGFDADTEKKVAAGAVVDTVWEATVGNMGRTIYVFEVQTKGSIDSLLVNLQKAMNNPAVQGVVAVSDAKQLDKIRSHSEGIAALTQNLKFWDYEEVARIHEALSSVNESINRLGLVPEGF